MNTEITERSENYSIIDFIPSARSKEHSSKRNQGNNSDHILKSITIKRYNLYQPPFQAIFLK